jgi:deoxyadenosine/deoxycytidine kinase
MQTTPSIVLVGLIGIGKTTICSELEKTIQKNDGIVTEKLFEPVHKWRKILERFYGDKKRWAYTLQQQVFSSRLALFLDVDWAKTELTISDGCIFMDRYAFAEMLHEGGYIDDLEMEEYLETFKNWRKIVPAAEPTIFVYLKTSDPKIALERIKERNRKEELAITEEYMRSLQLKIEAMLTLGWIGTRTIVVDGTKKESEVADDIHKKLKEMGFIDSIPRKTPTQENSVGEVSNKLTSESVV